MELQLFDGAFELWLQSILDLQGEAAPGGLGHAGRAVRLAVATITLVALTHANPRLELDHRLLLVHVDLQQGPLVLTQLSPPQHPPPSLNHPDPEGGRQQGPTHQGATPPGLDLASCLDLVSFLALVVRCLDSCSLVFFSMRPLTKQSRGLLVNLSPSTTALVSATKVL